jgi:aldehyde:ferredoxin oxidoreductase
MLDADKQILRIDMGTLTTRFEKTRDEWAHQGGRGLTSRIVNAEVPGRCDATGKLNKLVVAPGMITGTTAPSSGRLSVGGKSPLTGGIKEANAGGRSPQKIARAGIKAIIVENMPSDTDAWYNVILKHNDAQIVQANEYHKMGAYALIKDLYNKYPNKPGIIGSGPAGQMRLKGAGIFGNNVENTDPGRYAGRGGLGAVLGSKQVIAIVTDDTDGSICQPIDKEKFRVGSDALKKCLTEHPITGKNPDGSNGALKDYGTGVLMNVMNEAGGLPSKNWTMGHWEGAKNISGEAVHELIDLAVAKYGDATSAQYAHACNPGCVMKCSNVVPREDGSMHVSPLEYESACLLGSNLMIENLEHIAELNRLCNDLGLDSIETGNALGVAMEAGVIPWGDGKAAIAALKEVQEGTPLGRVLGSGALTTGNVFGVTRVAHVKGQSMPAYDPRPVRGIGVIYATGTMGADNTQGYTIKSEIFTVKDQIDDPRGVNKADLARTFLEATAYIDSAGYCIFTALAILDVDEGFVGLVDTTAAMFNTDWTINDVARLGRETLEQELAFNRAAGMTNLDDRLPEFMKTEPLPPHNVTFDVTDEELDRVHGNGT